MTGPHPIVGIAAEVADRRGGSAHQPDVGINLLDEGEVLVAAEERLHRNLHAGILTAEFLGQRLDIPGSDLPVLLLSGDRGHVAHDFGSHVADLADEAHLEPRNGQLLGGRHGPEAVLEVVVLDGRELLDRPVAAVVVREEQPLGRDDLARAAVAEDDDGILERGAVDAVNLLGGEFAAAGLHVLDIHFLEVREHPHALVGHGRKRHAGRRAQ